ARNLDAEARQQLTRQRARRNTRGGFAGAGALEHVTDVGMSVLHRAGEVGVSWTRACDRRAVGAGRTLRHLLLDVHGLLPVHPIAIANENRDRGASRPPLAHAGQDLRAVAFDLHAAAAAVAALAAFELAIERV